MAHSIKTEIIYYGLPTDFEFEFNLCGSCQMRLLTDSVSESTSLLKSLQRSITRSRVIIIVGPVTGENNVISLVSKAIGYDCEYLDTNVFQLKSAEPTLIIKDSVPLIADGGTFGGCIIESGPQSMIFLSEDKKIRKNLMSSLVHAYLADLSKFPTIPTQETTIPILNEEPATEPTEETEQQKADEILETSDVPLEEQSDNITTESFSETEELTPTSPPTEFEDFQTYSTPKELPAQHDTYNIENIERTHNIDIENAEEYFSDVMDDEDFYSTTEKQKKDKNLNILTLILSVILLLLLIYIVYGFIYLPLRDNISIAENFKNTFSFLIN